MGWLWAGGGETLNFVDNAPRGRACNRRQASFNQLSQGVGFDSGADVEQQAGIFGGLSRRLPKQRLLVIAREIGDQRAAAGGEMHFKVGNFGRPFPECSPHDVHQRQTK